MLGLKLRRPTREDNDEIIDDDVDPVRRLEGLKERPRLGRPLEHLPVAGDQHEVSTASFFRDHGDAGELLALEQLERSAAARRDP